MAPIDGEGERTIGWSHYLYLESKLLDALCVIAGYGLAEVTYFRDRAPGLYWQRFSTFVIIAVVTTVALNHLLGLYGHSPRDAWTDKVRRLALSGAIMLSVLAIVYPLGRRLRFEQAPISVVIAGCALAAFAMGLVRMSFRLAAWILEHSRHVPAPPGHGVS